MSHLRMDVEPGQLPQVKQVSKQKLGAIEVLEPQPHFLHAHQMHTYTHIQTQIKDLKTKNNLRETRDISFQSSRNF